VDDRIVRLESTVEQLYVAVQSLQQRVESLEGSGSTAVAPEVDRLPAAPPEARPRLFAAVTSNRSPYDPIVVLTLIGRLFLVLAGGFFLRAMTEAGVLAAPVGVGMAFVYALIWLAFADRAGGQGQSLSALLHSLAAALVAFPLLIEATTRFEVIGAAGSVLGLVVLTGAFLAVAVRRKLQSVAWITVVAALPTSAILLLKTGAAAPFVLYLIALGVTTIGLAYTQGWTLIRWPAAIAADLAVAGVTLHAFTHGDQVTSWVVLLLQVSLVGAYLGSIAVRTLLRDHNVTLFEVIQTIVALVVGFGGAVLLTRSTGTLPVVMGFASLLFGGLCYALAFRFVGRHAEHERNVHFYSSLALVLVLAGLSLDLPGPWLGAIAASFAVPAVFAWSRYGRPDMLLHGVAYLVAAAVATGAMSYATLALVSSPERWTLPRAMMFTVAVAGAFAAYFAAGRPRPAGGVSASIARFVIAFTLVWVASGCVTGYIAWLVARSPEGVMDLGVLATVRTGVLATVTLLVAAVARRDRFHEWAWLVYPLLVFIGLKMVAQDFKHSRPATLFIALAFFGIALILAPRLKRRGGRQHVQSAKAEIGG